MVFVARKPAELKAAISEAFAVDGPAIVDAVVVADELPNLPHVNFGSNWKIFALAKIKGSPSRGDRSVRPPAITDGGDAGTPAPLP